MRLPYNTADTIEEGTDAVEEWIYTPEQRISAVEKWDFSLEKSSVAVEDVADAVGEQRSEVRGRRSVSLCCRRRGARLHFSVSDCQRFCFGKKISPQKALTPQLMVC